MNLRGKGPLHTIYDATISSETTVHINFERLKRAAVVEAATEKYYYETSNL